MENTAKQIVVSENTLPSYKREVRVLVIVLISFIALMFTDNNVRMVFKVADPKLLACMGLLCFYTVYKFIRDYGGIQLETVVVEDLDSDQGRIDLFKNKIPLEIEQANSFFIKSFAKISASMSDDNSEISLDRKTALQLEYFEVNDDIAMFMNVLLVMGFLGTLMGLSKALALIDAGEMNAVLGMAYAFSTTFLAMIAKIVIVPMNKKLRHKKKLLFCNFLDVISRSIKKRRAK